MDEFSLTRQEVAAMTSALILRAASFLVDNPQHLRAEIIPGKRNPVLVLTVPESDIKWLVGRNGRTADALRTLTDALSARLKNRIQLLIESHTPEN